MPSLKIKLLHVVCSALCEISRKPSVKGYTFMSFFNRKTAGFANPAVTSYASKSFLISFYFLKVFLIQLEVINIFAVLRSVNVAV